METSRNTSPRDTATLEDPTATGPGEGTLTESGSPAGNAVELMHATSQTRWID